VKYEQREHEQQQHVAVPEGVEAGHMSKDEAPAQKINGAGRQERISLHL
jgi:hypothetical protein